MPKHLFVLGAFLGLAITGCGEPEEIVAKPAEAAAAPFEGKVDPKIVGTWKSTDGRSTIVLNADGTTANHAKVPSPKGVQEMNTKGKWLAQEDALLLKDEGKDAIRYFVTLTDPTTLELRRVKGSNIVITYKKA